MSETNYGQGFSDSEGGLPNTDVDNKLRRSTKLVRRDGASQDNVAPFSRRLTVDGHEQRVSRISIRELKLNALQEDPDPVMIHLQTVEKEYMENAQTVEQPQVISEESKEVSADPLTHESLPPAPRFTAHTIDLSNIPGSGPLMERTPFISAKDFKAPCVPLIGLFGESMDLHKVIVQNVPGKFPLRFLSSNLLHVLPPKTVEVKPVIDSPVASGVHGSPSPLSSNFSLPVRTDGILALEWFSHHQQRLTSVAVLVFEWNPDMAFEQIEDSVLRSVNKFRDANSTRFAGANPVKLLVLFVRHADTSEVKDQGLANFWKKASLPNKRFVFVLMTTSLRDSLNNLESTLWSIALEYYSGIIKYIKRLRDTIDEKDKPILLMVRLNFKLGYFYQITREQESSISHFKNAMEYLYKLPITNSNCYEIKNFAYLLTFMICKQLLDGGTGEKSQEAIDMFFAHIDHFQNVYGRPDLEFRHWSWMQHQFLTMGELLDLYPSPMALTNRTHHSTYYFHYGAQFARQRQQSYQTSYNLWNPNYQEFQQHINDQIFYGQIGFISKKSKIKQVDDEEELEMETILVPNLERDLSYFFEFNVNHADDVISTLKKAYKSAKRINSHRSLLFLGREIARENFLNRRFVFAKPLYDNLLETYRKESWITLLGATLKEALICARELKLPVEISKYCLEILGRYIIENYEEKSDIQRELIAELVKISKDSESTGIIFPIHPVYKLLNVQTTFGAAEFECGSEFFCHIDITSSFPDTLHLRKIRVITSSEEYDFEIMGMKGDLMLLPNVCQQHDQNLSITSQVEDFHIKQLILFPLHSGDVGFSYSLPSLTKINVWKSVAKFDIQFSSSSPGIVGEYFKIHLTLTTTSEMPQVVSLNFAANSFPTSDESCVFFHDESGNFISLKDYPSFLHSIRVSLEEPAVFDVFLTAIQESVIHLDVALLNHQRIVLKSSLKTQFFNPFTFGVYPLSGGYLPYLDSKEDEKETNRQFLEMFNGKIGTLVISVLNNSQHNLFICGLRMSLINTFSVGQETQFFKKSNSDTDDMLCHGESFTDLFPIHPKVVGNTSPGTLACLWRRSDDESTREYCTTISIPAIQVSDPGLSAQLTFAHHCTIGESVLISLKVNNRTEMNQDVEYQVADTKDFLLSGKKFGRMTVLPRSSTELYIKLVPLTCGLRNIPEIKVVSQKTSYNLLPAEDLGHFLSVAQTLPSN